MAVLTVRQKRQLRVGAAAVQTPVLALFLLSVIDIFWFLVLTLLVLCGCLIFQSRMHRANRRQGHTAEG